MECIAIHGSAWGVQYSMDRNFWSIRVFKEVMVFLENSWQELQGEER